MNHQSSKRNSLFLLVFFPIVITGLAITLFIAIKNARQDVRRDVAPVQQLIPVRPVPSKGLNRDTSSMQTPAVETVVVNEHRVPDWGAELLGKGIALEDEQAVQYSTDEKGEIVASGLHGAPIVFPDLRFASLLKSGQRAIVYRKLTDPQRQVIEFVGRKAEELDRDLVAKLGQDDLLLWNGPVQTNHGVAFLFVTAKEFKELQDRKEFEAEMEARRKK